MRGSQSQVTIYDRWKKASQQRKQTLVRLKSLDKEISILRKQIYQQMYDIAYEMRATRREREIFEGIERGESNKEIAAKLCISERAVKFHITNLLAKYECRNRMELKERVKIS